MISKSNTAIDGAAAWAVAGASSSAARAARIRRIIAAAALGCAALIAEWAVPAVAATDADWPCLQPAGPQLTRELYRDGPAGPAAPSWQSDAQIVGLVAAIAPREASLAESTARLTGFIDSLPPAARGVAAAQVLDGLVDVTNQARDRVIARIRQLGRRERDLTRTIAGLDPDRDAGDAFPRRELARRALQALRQTMRYACDVPATLDARLGQLARTLRDRAGG